MALLPVPYDGKSGAVDNPVERLAQHLHTQYKFMFRWIDEISVDPDLDYKKLAQFAFHCKRYREFWDLIQAASVTTAQKLDALQGTFFAKGCKFADRPTMAADLASLRDAADAEFTWIAANLPEARSFSVQQFDENWNLTDSPIRVPFPAAYPGRAITFRARFAAN